MVEWTSSLRTPVTHITGTEPVFPSSALVQDHNVEWSIDLLTLSRNLNDLDLSHFERATAVMQTSVFLALKHGSQAMMVTSDAKPHPGGSFVVTSSCSSFLGGTATADLSYGM